MHEYINYQSIIVTSIPSLMGWFKCKQPLTHPYILNLCPEC